MDQPVVYTVVGRGGDLGERWTHLYCVCKTVEGAAKWIVEKKARAALKADRYAKLQLFRTFYKECRPSPKYPAMAEYPRWPSGSGAHNITAEMRDERNTINASNAALRQSYDAELFVYETLQREAEVQYCVEQYGMTQEEAKKFLTSVQYYSAIYEPEIEYSIETQSLLD